MKLSELNPKAKEAFGKSLIDVSTAIFKSMILLFTVVPLIFIVQNVIENKESQISIAEAFQKMSDSTFWLIIVFYTISFFAAYFLKNEGLKQIHEASELEKLPKTRITMHSRRLR